MSSDRQLKIRFTEAGSLSIERGKSDFIVFKHEIGSFLSMIAADEYCPPEVLTAMKQIISDQELHQRR